MLKFIFSIVVMVLAGGCAPDSRHFVKDGVSPEEYRADAYACERDTRMSAGSFGTGVTAPTYAQNFAIRCMASKGYRLELAEGRGRVW